MYRFPTWNEKLRKWEDYYYYIEQKTAKMIRDCKKGKATRNGNTANEASYMLLIALPLLLAVF
jgi:hypothetical protein